MQSKLYVLYFAAETILGMPKDAFMADSEFWRQRSYRPMALLQAAGLRRLKPCLAKPKKRDAIAAHSMAVALSQEGFSAKSPGRN